MSEEDLEPKSEEERLAAESFNMSRNESATGGLEDQSDEDFMRKFPEDGFGWATYTEADKPIVERWQKLHKIHPELNRKIGGDETSAQTKTGTNEKIDDLLPNKLDRNYEGKLVDPRTNEPVREGSPEWQELRRRGEIR